MMILLIFVIVLFTLSIFIKNQSEFRQIDIGGNKLMVEIAKTNLQKINGLSNRKVLDNDTGMLFYYNDYVLPDFWMKEMNFSLDIIWIKDNRVVEVSENLLPEGVDPKNIYRPSQPVNFVLEVPGGYVAQKQIKIGDKFIIDK